uniref:GB1/RHD3-type G domain-containing protein n=1 Tax=Macrostomum lignano TaxID=282301 RepID=A0A1I8GUX2_9PLAT
MEVPHPVQLTTLVETESGAERFRLNQNIWAEMQSADRLQKSKVAVISVAGAFRKGKSFLLNFFLRFLKAASCGDASQWLRSDERLSDGFHWRSGSERDTTGILIWSEPFFIRKPDGQEVAVLLMDTQGTFDHQSTQQDCTSIFAFSTLLSSVQIFNISQNIQETDLQHLRLFVEFASIASDSQDSVLQHLWFLIRDWQYPDEYEFGVEGGRQYLDKVLECDPKKPMENLELRQGIRKFFENTSCCLLPHPGFAVTRKDFHGELDKISPEFLAEIDKLAARILSPECLASKAVNGRALTGSELITFAEVYYEAFRSGRLPSSRTILSATVDLTNLAVSKASKELFEQKVASRVDPAAAVTDEEFESLLGAATLEALAYFDKNCMQKSSEATADCRAGLEEDLQQHPTETTATAIQLIIPDEKNTGFSLNPKISAQVKDLDRMLKAKIAIICVAGAFRKGKSFLLNFFLRYLTALVSGNTEDWINSDDHHRSGFHWKSGSKRDTTGILLWSQPFFIRKPDGQEVAVLLMDTQGTFDHQTTQQDCTTIFAFSTLLSSVQIFNLSQNISEADLQNLRLFVEFAALAKSSEGKALQHLWFLIRDWQFPDEHQYGEEGGSEYLSTVLDCSADRPQENKELREGIKKHFEKASCYLLPHPGKAVRDSKFTGDVQRLETEFVEEIESFVEKIAAPENITVKKVNGNELSGSELIDFMEVYFEAFSSGRMPTPSSVFSATVEMVNMTAASNSKRLFEDKVKSFLDPAKSDEEFQAAVDEASKEALDAFNSKCMESDSSEVRKAKKKLQDDLTELKDKAVLNRQLRSEKLTAEKKSDLLKGEMEGLKQQTQDRQKQMQEMEATFKTTIEQIKSESISKEEMERKLQEEALKQDVARIKMEEKNNELRRQISQMQTMSAQSSAAQIELINLKIENARLEERERMRCESIRHEAAAAPRGGGCSIQ